MHCCVTEKHEMQALAVNVCNLTLYCAALMLLLMPRAALLGSDAHSSRLMVQTGCAPLHKFRRS